jgi:hypothetical protein
MKTKKTLLYMAAVLCMSISCKKELVPEDRFAPHPELDCESINGNCCSPLPGIKYRYVTEFKDELIFVSQISDDKYSNMWGSGVFTPIGQRMGGYLCELGTEKLKTLSPTPITNVQLRVSGKVYADRGIAIFCKECFFPYYLSIEKAELVR